jgi:hypothetical protein
MTVKDLIQRLQKVKNKDLTVAADTQDGAGYDVTKVEELENCVYFS